MLTKAKAIEYLNGTAANLRALAEDGEDVVVDALEVEEVADKLRAIARLLALLPDQATACARSH